MKRRHMFTGPEAPHHHPTEMFDPREGGHPFGHRRGPGRGGRGRGGRMPRGDVRTAILLILSDEPMHGYQLMQAIAERSGGRWRPSPGAIYPAINLLEDEGLVDVTAQSGRKVVALTQSGRDYVAAEQEAWTDPFTAFEGEAAGPDLRDLAMQLAGAVRQVGRTGNAAQIAATATILSDARRSIYLMLADGSEAPAE